MNATNGSHYLIFGGAGGIGSTLASQLIDRGHRVTIAGRTEEKLKEVAQKFSIPHFVVDATDFKQVDDCYDQVTESHGRLDGVVNCVGSLMLKPASMTSSEEFRDAIDKNLTSAFAVVRGSSRALREHGGSVVLMSSAAARTGLSNHEAISAAKAGVIGLTMSAAATLATAKIRVNAVAPGLVKTGLTKNIWSRESAAETSRGFHALGRLGEPKDIAAMIQLLLEPTNDWITGQVFGVDGGLSAVAIR